MREPLVEHNEDSVVWTWPDAPDPVRLTFTSFREGPDGLKCEVRVETASPVQDGKHGLYHWATFNLSSTSARSTLVRTLAGRTDRNPWALMLEAACAKTAELWRQGAPVVDLADEPELTKVEYLIEPLVPLNETTLILADGDSLKSWLAIALAVSMQASKPIGRLWPRQRVPVLYLDYETGRSEVRRRIGWIARGLGLDNVPSFFYREQHRALVDDAAQLRAEVRRRNVGLVIVDSLGPGVGDDLEKSGPAIAAMHALRSLPCTRVVLAHVSKATAEQRNGRGRAFGSAFFENLARSVWEMRGDEDPSERRVGLFHRKVNVGRKLGEPIGLRFQFDDTRRTLSIQSADVTDTPEIAQYASLRVRIHAALRDGAKNTRELAETLGVSEAVVRTTLSRMADVHQLTGGKPGRNGSSAVWGLTAQDPF